MKIEILYFDGCPSHELADRRVREVLEEMAVDAELVRINVKDQATAIEVRFPGSPTVRINGEDVVPVPSGEPHSMRCRVYPASTGFEGAPNKAEIRAAIEKSAA